MTHRHFGIEPRFAPQPLPSAARSATSAVKASPRAEVANIQAVRPALRGIEQPVSRHDAIRSADPSKFPLPSRSIIAAGAPLEPLNLSETVKDIAALAFTFLFIGSVSIGFAVSMFLLFFVELH